jgi:hypothetical protein
MSRSCAGLRGYWLVEHHHLGDEGFHVACVSQAAGPRNGAKIFGCIAGIIGFVIILREEVEQSLIIRLVAAL